MQFELSENLKNTNPRAPVTRTRHRTPSNLTTGENDDLMHFVADHNKKKIK